ncbi:MAG: DUF1559 domain-containing protein [Planctomycetota bacterium]|nr:DUF1559 domain-containing protein [Planctomycetota bacterium]
MAVVLVAAVAVGLIGRGAGLKAAEPVGPNAWTLDEALEQVRLHPRDIFLQYVALQLARRENRLEQILPTVAAWQPRPGPQDPQRTAGVDLFNLFSGALAVQESLQLDTMRGEEGRPTGPRPNRTPAPQGKTPPPGTPVAIATLTGPTIQSHPWEKMLGDKQPEISPLARCVPDDFYFVEFRSLSKLLDLADHGDLWGTHLFSQSQQEARSQLVGDRLKQQLALETSGLLRPFYDLVVEDVAATGSDLFLREGSDVTVLFRFRQAAVFKPQMELFLDKAAKSQPDARRSQGECLGVPYEHVTSPNRAVHVFAAYPQPNLHVRSNSRVALERVLAAIRGQDAQGQAVTRLGDTKEFAFIRTLMPRGAAEEDGLVYLSDPFIRRLVGPQVKLTERRRMVCYNHLRMIGHASLLYRTERGRVPASLPELEAGKCSPGEFGKDNLSCPDGGRYTLSADGSGGVCSHHGRPQGLIPCCEIPLTQVTEPEAAAYRQFLGEYEQYWRTFFDPIAIRIQVAPQRYRVETIVLPLIDNSIYTRLAQSVGGKPEPLDSLPVPKRNIFSVAVRLNKANLIRESGLQSLLEAEEAEAAPAAEREAEAAAATKRKAEAVGRTLQQLARGWQNYHDTFKFFPSASVDATGQKSGLSWRVHVLAFTEHRALYDKFHRNEPWDSEHNRQLIAEMPELYRPANKQLAAAGKTKFVTLRGDQTICPTEPRQISMRDITDGTSNTLMLVEADDEHAVVWTKPDDLEVDWQKPAAGLAVRPPGGFLVAFADGSIQFLRNTIAADTLAALMTRAGGEPVALQPEDQLAFQLYYERPQLFGLSGEVLGQLNIGAFLSKGIGNYIGLHVYDSEPMFDFSLPRLLGLSLGSFQGGGRRGNEWMLMAGVFISALNSPVYVSVPVQDAKLVDEFLVRLDGFLARVAHRRFGNQAELFGVEQDYYQLSSGDPLTRSYGVRFGPIKWRFFWARIGNGLYVASQPYILEDLAALQAGPAAKPDAARDVVGHGLVRIRPQHWQQVLTGYQLGWAENNREACLNNVGPLSSLARAWPPTTADKTADEIHAALVKLGERFCDAHCFCPDGGQYQLSTDGKSVTCTLHGTALAPRQQSAPAANSELGRLLRNFADMTLTLTFLKDGLHAVATIDRQPRK